MPLDEARKPEATAFVGMREEGREVLAQDAVEDAAFGLSALSHVARPSSP